MSTPDRHRQHFDTRFALRERVSGPFGQALRSTFRVMPQQARAMTSVERLLAAVPRLVTDARALEELSLEGLAREAHVTPQAAYRYFRGSTDLVRLFARYLQTLEMEGLQAKLLDRRFVDADEMANTVVSSVTAIVVRFLAVPPRLRAALLRDYLEIGYDSIWALSEIIGARWAAPWDPGDGLRTVFLNGALVAVVSIAASYCARGDAGLADPSVQAMLHAIFTAAVAQVAGVSPHPAMPGITPAGR